MSLIQTLIEENSLAGWWDFRSGTADDLSGNGYHGTFVGTPVIQRDGIRFDGVSNALNYGAAFNTLQATTFAMWVKFRASAAIGFFFSKYLSLVDNWGMYYAGGNLVIFDDVDNADAARYGQAVSSDVWHHIAVSFTAAKEQRLYVDGVLTGSGAFASDFFDSYAGALTLGERTAGVSRSPAIFGSVVAASRELTNTEIVQLMAEMRDQRWPSSPTVQSEVNPKDHTAVPLASNSMRPCGNRLVDLGGEPLNDFLVGGGPRSSQGFLGPGVLCGTLAASALAASYEIIGSLWFSVWFKTGSDVATAQVLFSRYANATDSWSLRISGGKIAIFDDIDNAGAVRYNTTIRAHEWYNVIVGMLPDRVNQMWINAVAAANNEVSADNLASFAGGTYLGGLDTTLSPFLGTIFDYEVFLDTPKVDDIATRYLAGARAVQFKTDWGTPVTVPASVGAGAVLGPYTVSSGTHKISTDAIEGRTTKVIECVTAGVVYVDTRGFMGTSEAAFGTWELWVKKALTANDMDIVLIGDTIGGLAAAGQDGYGFRYANTDDGIYLYESVAGGLTDLGHFIGVTPAGSWYLLHLDREFDGSLNMWIGDNSGVGSALDLTTVTGRYVCFDMDAGDKVALSDVQGNHCFVKKLGAIT